MTRLNSTGFGYIIVDGKEIRGDVVVCNDKVFPRPKELSRKYRGLFGHTPLSREELEYVVMECGKPSVLVIGTGQYGALPVMEEARNYIREIGVKLVVGRTPEVLDKVNNLLEGREKVIALIHVTC